ncbi:unnamed protein product [Symbiodinium natans]|uniref:Uncharacterized protein n=1 Tax=Symbiodinium natans TaxID=878477 RepID=A0A812RIS6_9DINO|nr:unnamed protein product [Symbiodinium natans]
MGGNLCNPLQEWELANPGTTYKDSLIAGSLQLPDTAQQESAHDCGFFILEQVLRLLQLSPTALRSLAQRSTEDVAGLPWPAQREVVKRKKKLREITADLFVAARRQGTGDVEALLKQDEAVLRKKLLLAMWEGPYFAKAVANLIGMDPGPLPEVPTLPKEEEAKKHEADEESDSEETSERQRPELLRKPQRWSETEARGEPQPKQETHRADRPARPPPPPTFTKEDLQGYPSKTLRNLCVQYKVLPPGMVERTDLLKALERLAIVKNAVPAGTAAAAKAVGERLANGRPDLPSFTTDDLDTMPISKLKMFCIQFGRLPSGSLEKSDLKKALAPLAKPSSKPAFSGNGGNGTTVPSGHSSGHHHHHHRKRALPSFTSTELDTMPISRLKSYCIQYGKMPHGPVERTDLTALLRPFAIGGSASAASASETSVPGTLTPGAASATSANEDSFVLEDLKTMSPGLRGMKMLKTFCLKHKVMPHGPVEKCDLQKALENLNPSLGFGASRLGQATRRGKPAATGLAARSQRLAAAGPGRPLASLSDITNLQDARDTRMKKAARPREPSVLPQLGAPAPPWPWTALAPPIAPPAPPAPPAKPEPEQSPVAMEVSNPEAVAKAHQRSQSAAEYVPQIMDRLFEEEAACLPRPCYMESQQDINGKMRAILIDWLVEVHMKYRLRAETLFLAVNLIDRHMSALPVLRRRLQLVGVVGMFVAAKFEEIDPPRATDFVYITDNTYSKEDLLQMECTMLSALDFRVVVPTPAHFFNQFLKANNCDNPRHTETIKYILELALIDLRMIRYTPSHLLAAAVLLSNDLFSRAVLWPDIMVQTSRHTEDELRGCAEELRLLLRAAPASTLQAVRKKYMLQQYHRVANNAVLVHLVQSVARAEWCKDICKAVAGRLGGHTWNIITNSDKHEIYLTQARSRDHYINDRGEITSVWFERRRRIPHPVGGLEGANWSANVKESLLCPGTPRAVPAKAPRAQLLQAAAPRDFPLYSARRREVAPPSPERPGHLERTLVDQARLRDSLTPRAPKKVVGRKDWTPRRGELLAEPKPPKEEEMFSSVCQLRAESHVDVQQGLFAQQLTRPTGSGRSSGPPGLPDSGVLRAALFSHRSSAGTPRAPEDRVNHSQSRIESFAQREISNWALGDDKLLRKDPFCMRPMQQPNNSGVKYDIITNERDKFWY